MKNALVPLTISDIEFGKEYLLVEMWLNNSRHLKPLVIIEEIRTREKKRCILVHKNRTADEQPHTFADLGLIPAKQINKWRVFENTPENRQALEKLVANKSALDYLLAIGLSEREALETIRKNSFELEKKRATDK